MLCGYCNYITSTALTHLSLVEPPVMLCGYCNDSTGPAPVSVSPG